MTLSIRKRPWLKWTKKQQRHFRRYLTMLGGTFKIWIDDYPDGLHAFVAFLDDEPVGMALIHEADNLSGCYVRPRYRGKGIGFKLMRRLSLRFPYAEVSHHNKQSFKLFSKFNKRLNEHSDVWGWNNLLEE